MKDWRERMDAAESWLQEWNGVYAREHAQLRRQRQRRFRKASEAELGSIAAEARRRAGEDGLAETSAFLDELCAAYLAEPLSQIQAQMRSRIANRPALFDALWSCVDGAAQLIRGPQDGERLRLALAAASLDDMRSDLRKLEEAVARLYSAALRAGIEPRPYLEAVAQASNPSTGGGGGKMREWLLEFEGSLAFKRAVEPELKSAAKR
ncbi:MAG TPA: hypothetical protein VMS76_11465 [Planctomycetota bacterium]|nr:hypothetical protein [Planctomycetota bacterium]